MLQYDNTMISFVMITIILTITPGVDTFVVMRNVLRGGRKDGILTGFGICSGLFVHASLSVLGISIILVKSAYLFSLLKTLGALYLVWLGISSLYAAFCSKVDIKFGYKQQTEFESLNLTKSFREGLISNVLNPKCAVFYMAFFPQFISGDQLVFVKSMSLVMIQFIIGVLWLTVLSLLLVQFRRAFEKPVFHKTLYATCGLVLVSLGIRLGLEK